VTDFVTFTILGLALGSIYAIAAAGLVVTYTTSGIFNFAHGAIAMFAAFIYWQLRWDDGWGGQWPAPLALIVVLFVAAPLFGIIMERLIMRSLRGGSQVARVIVPVAVLLFLSGLASWIWSGLKPRTPKPFFGTTAKISVGDVQITTHQIIIFAVAIGLAAVLWFLLTRTRIGITMRAVVDNRELTQLNGGRPEFASAAAWAIGCMTAALAGILISSLQSRALDVNTLTLLVVNAYAAAIFGRLRSLPLTFLGAMIVGLAVNYWNWISDTGTKWPWAAGMRVSLPVIILFIVLITLPEERLRGAALTRTKERFRMPKLSRAWLWAGILVAVVLSLIPITESAPQSLLGNVLALAIIAQSLVLLTGYAGEINLAPMTFAGIGAMVLFQVDVGPQGSAAAESASLFGYLLAAVITGIVGALVALPALRLRGLYLALATFSFAVLVSNLVFKQLSALQLNIPFFGDGEDIEINLFSGGSLGIPKPNWFGVNFAESQSNWLIFLAAVFGLIGVGLIALRRSSFGRQLSAMKDSPAACATLGLNMVRLKLSVFALSAAIAGFGGALYGGQIRSVNEDNFVIFQSLVMVLLTVVGGIGYVTGALFSGIMNGAAFTVVGNIFDKLSDDYVALAWLFTWIGSFVVFLGPAGSALSLGRNPSGAMNQFFENWSHMKQKAALPFIFGWAVIQSGLYVLVLTDSIGNWAWVIVSLTLLALLPQVSVALRPSLVMSATEMAARSDAADLDMIGIDRPFTEQDRLNFDEALDISTRHGEEVGSGASRN
jgi:branched-chain amino acid transport system permease protein